MYKKIFNIGICFMLFCNLGCVRDNAFQRNIDFNSGWTENADNLETISGSCYSKMFDLDINDESIYMLHINSQEEPELRINNKVVPVILESKDICCFNITSYLKRVDNSAILSFKENKRIDFNNGVDVSLSKLKKLYISDVQASIDNKDLKLVELDVCVNYVSAFKEEKQGVLSFVISDLQGEEITGFKTPVFPKANSKNAYIRKVSLDSTKIKENKGSIMISCQMFSLNEIVDCVHKKVVLKEQ